MKPIRPRNIIKPLSPKQVGIRRQFISCFKSVFSQMFPLASGGQAGFIFEDAYQDKRSVMFNDTISVERRVYLVTLSFLRHNAADYWPFDYGDKKRRNSANNYAKNIMRGWGYENNR